MRECIVCKTAELSKFYCHIEQQDYLRCDDCGLIYIDKLLQTKTLYKAYSGNYFKSLRRKIVSPFRKIHQFRNYQDGMKRAEQIVAFISDHLDATQDKPKYMDIGCNRGYLLVAAMQRGWTPYGVELVPELMAPFNNSYPEYKSQIFSERFEDVRKKYLQPNMFDAISGIDVVEHFEDVVNDIAGIYSVLKPGGIVVFQTPDAGCDRAKQEKCEWGALKPLEHLHLFTAAGLEKVAREVGFSDYKVYEQFEEADGNFVALLKK